MDLAWENSTSHVLINPSYPREDQLRFQRILEAAQEWPGHIWLSTSGSSACKWVGLSKGAILASAAAVNHHLQSCLEDRWVHALPDFHVGGVGIWARAYLSGVAVSDFKRAHPGKWQAEAFYRYVEQTRGTLTALVPAQLHDLVGLGWPAPPSLRVVVIGGGALLPAIYERAVSLGWPLLPSYGLTECASQVATAALGSWNRQEMPALHLLSHIQGCEREGCLCFAGSSLLSVYAYLQEGEVRLIDPKLEGWFKSEDRGRVQEGRLHMLGRLDAVIKIGGESVDLSRLEVHLQTLCVRLGIQSEMALIAMPDPRLGHVIHLVVASWVGEECLDSLIQQFQQGVLPFERVRQTHRLPYIPRSPLGKILRQELMALVIDG